MNHQICQTQFHTSTHFRRQSGLGMWWTNNSQYPRHMLTTFEIALIALPNREPWVMHNITLTRSGSVIIMASQHSRLYRRLVREVAKASIAPRSQRNQEISTNFRTLFERNHQSETFQHDVEDVLTFMHSQRQYKTLLERYNPLVDLTAEERIEATARRVGLNMPVTSGSEK